MNREERKQKRQEYLDSCEALCNHIGHNVNFKKRGHRLGGGMYIDRVTLLQIAHDLWTKGAKVDKHLYNALKHGFTDKQARRLYTIMQQFNFKEEEFGNDKLERETD